MTPTRLSQLARLLPLATAELYPVGVPVKYTVTFHDGQELSIPLTPRARRRRGAADEPAGERAADEPARPRGGERREAVIGALRATDRPITRREIAELSGLRDNTKLSTLLQHLVEVEKSVKRLPKDLYWLAERPLLPPR